MSQDMYDEEDRVAQQEYVAGMEEAHFYSVIKDFIDLVDEYGYEKVGDVMGKMLANYR